MTLGFIGRNINKIFLFATIVGVIFGIILCIVDSAESYDEQKASLYEKEELFAGDINNLKDVENVRVYIGEERITITFEEDDCKLITVYDKNWKLLSKEYEEVRLSGSFWSLVITLCFCAVGSIVVFGALIFAVGLVAIIIECIVKELRNKKVNKES